MAKFKSLPSRMDIILIEEQLESIDQNVEYNFLNKASIKLLDDGFPVLKLKQTDHLQSYDYIEIILVSLFKFPRNNTWIGLWDCSFKAWETYYRDEPSISWFESSENIEEIKDVFSEVYQELLYWLLLFEFRSILKKVKLKKSGLPVNNVKMMSELIIKINECLSTKGVSVVLVKEIDGVFWGTVATKLTSTQLFSIEKLINYFLLPNDCKLFLKINDTV